MTKEIHAIAILRKDGSVYLQRLAPKTASEDSLTSQEKVIIELYYQLQESQLKPQEGEWISVEDKLPNEHQDIIVYYYGNKNSKYFPSSQFMKQSSFYNDEFECNEEVTHWKTLSTPPKG